MLISLLLLNCCVGINYKLSRLSYAHNAYSLSKQGGWQALRPNPTTPIHSSGPMVGAGHGPFFIVLIPLSLSLSLSIYIYIYICVCIEITKQSLFERNGEVSFWSFWGVFQCWVSQGLLV